MATPVQDALETALGLHRAGRLNEAESACRAILTAEPAHVDALNLLGMIAGQNGNFELAADHFAGALVYAPDNWLVLSNLAEARRLQGRPAEAVPLLQQAIALAPSPLNHCHYRLAAALVDLGLIEDALAACRAGLRHRPKEPQLNGLAAELSLRLGRLKEAVSYLHVALEQAPEDDRHWECLGRLLPMIVLPAEGRPMLLKALTHPIVRPAEIARSVARTLCQGPAIEDLLAHVERGALPSGPALSESLMPLSSDALLLSLMQTTFIPWPPLERLFTALRRALLLDAKLDDVPLEGLPFCTALAINAFLADYAWDMSEEEEAAVQRLAARIGQALQGTDPPPAFALALLGAYRPLHELDAAPRIGALDWPASLADLVRTQVLEPLQERVLWGEIPRLTPVHDPVSREVRAQYEEHPYPRWTRAGKEPEPVSLRNYLGRIGGVIPDDPSFASPDVLVAGCGTGLQSVYAASFYRDARILAVDLSLASLAYALRKTRELGVTRIDYRQADLLELGSLDQRFHVVECLGVLHHLADPLAGWRVLVDLLRPGGLMHIALYSELARRPVTLAREHIASRGYQANASDIRRCRRDILDLPDGHPLAALRRMRDLYNTNECRDLLFHVQEHRYDLLRVGRLLDELGLRFLGFNSPPRADAYLKRFPDDPQMTSLANWHEFEQDYPDAFIGMYNFRAQKIAS